MFRTYVRGVGSVMRCPANQKLNIVVFFLVESAKNWWKSKKRAIPATKSVNRELFTTRFKSNFLSPEFQTMKRLRFFHYSKVICE